MTKELRETRIHEYGTIGCIGRDVNVIIKYKDGSEGKGRVAALNPKRTGGKKGLFLAGGYEIESAGIEEIVEVVAKNGKNVIDFIKKDAIYDINSRSTIVRHVRGGIPEKVKMSDEEYEDLMRHGGVCE